MKLLISVRDADEALLAARGGADFIDLKEPGAGALGGLPVATIAQVVAVLRRAAVGVPISATIGDLPMRATGQIAAQVEAVGACGVDYVKVGIERTPGADAVLDLLAGSGRRVVPVFIADRGIDAADLAHACALGFPGVMLDTADKIGGSLFERMPLEAVQRFVRTVQRSGAMVGLAGALRLEHATWLARLAPDFAGFRSAVCAGDRASTLDPQRLQALAAALRGTSVERLPA